ncbi:hypothetical protein PR048_005448 [Dryococelus australis]|uniref:Uncharacterized protein n=1 Tax=Dryococelus australis TaxID=614101 RepID=A0ABQ9I8S2_9NEOP|nr:hypothetical protein PR048_005448 [Dryococelus australis]
MMTMDSGWALDSGGVNRRSRENPLTNSIIRHDSYMRKSGVTRPGIELGLPCWEASRLITQPCSGRDRGGVVVRLLASNQGKPDSVPGGVTPGFSHMGIVPNDGDGRRVFSGISRFLSPFNPALLLTQLVSPSSALKTSM